MLRNHADDQLRRDLVGPVRIDDILQGVLGQLQSDLRLILDLGLGDDPVKAPSSSRMLDFMLVAMYWKMESSIFLS